MLTVRTVSNSGFGRVFNDLGFLLGMTSKQIDKYFLCESGPGDTQQARRPAYWGHPVLRTQHDMLNTEDSRSLISKARASGNGFLLQQVIDNERARLREHGSKEGLDKFKS